ncbi:tRNA dihydrouridine synthase DusB [Candidatus Woesearchaeota archaeon]|nr:tRNA dihydrouridine synthase DusB [Candidatus Woesearchaeota archaeon]
MKHKSQFPKLKSPVLLSPMAGVTDVAFRTLAKRYGTGLTYTEFVSSTALVRGSAKTSDMLRTSPQEKPVAVQLFGSSVQDVVDAARMLEDRFDIIDINCGCPAWKVIKTGAGSSLLNNPDKISTFINKLASAVQRPVTLKIRAGIDEQHINAVEIAKLAEDAGAAAIGVHGRTQKQGYAGQANWDIIRQVKEAVSIPIIGNGDIFTPETFKQRMDESGVDYIMVARGAMGNPYLCSQINKYLAQGIYDTKHPLEQLQEYLALAKQYAIAFPAIKNHTTNFTKGLQGSKKLRLGISQASTAEQMHSLLDTFQRNDEEQ